MNTSHVFLSKFTTLITLAQFRLKNRFHVETESDVCIGCEGMGITVTGNDGGHRDYMHETDEDVDDDMSVHVSDIQGKLERWRKNGTL